MNIDLSECGNFTVFRDSLIINVYNHYEKQLYHRNIEDFIYESWSEYDENKNLITYKTSDGYSKYMMYDLDNNMVYSEDSDEEWWYGEYNSTHNEIYSYRYTGMRQWTTYNDNGCMVHNKQIFPS